MQIDINTDGIISVLMVNASGGIMAQSAYRVHHDSAFGSCQRVYTASEPRVEVLVVYLFLFSAGERGDPLDACGFD